MNNDARSRTDDLMPIALSKGIVVKKETPLPLFFLVAFLVGRDWDVMGN